MINPIKMGIDPMNNISIRIRILFAVTIFQHSPLTRRVFFSSIMREREDSIINNIKWEDNIINIILVWHIYKSSEVFFISNIIILKGMPSSSASICISIKLIHHHHHNTRLAHHNTRLTLRHNCQVGSSVLVSSHCLSLRQNTQDGSKILVLLYVTTIRLEPGY
jgi:hypothetical protein